MRIDLDSVARQTTDSGELTQSRTTKADRNHAPISDIASLSCRSEALQTLNATASALPEIRQEKVAALAEMVRNGTYRVTAEQTAGALISQMRPVAAA